MSSTLTARAPARAAPMEALRALWEDLSQHARMALITVAAMFAAVVVPTVIVNSAQLAQNETMVAPTEIMATATDGVTQAVPALATTTADTASFIVTTPAALAVLVVALTLFVICALAYALRRRTVIMGFSTGIGVSTKIDDHDQLSPSTHHRRAIHRRTGTQRPQAVPLVFGTVAGLGDGGATGMTLANFDNDIGSPAGIAHTHV